MRRTLDITIFGKIAQNVEITHTRILVQFFILNDFIWSILFSQFTKKKTKTENLRYTFTIWFSLLKYNALKMNENTVGGV